MQLENANEIFGCIFEAVGLKAKDNNRHLVMDTNSVKLKLKKLTVNIVSAEDCDESHDEVPTNHQGFFSASPAALCLEGFELCKNSVTTNVVSHSNVLPITAQLDDLVIPTDIRIDISLASATQVVNIAIIRLLLQISETIDVIEEENKFAKKIKSLEHVNSHSTTRPNASYEKATFRDYRSMPKSWRTMFNVLQLYTSSQSLLDKDEDTVGMRSPQSTIRK